MNGYASKVRVKICGITRIEDAVAASMAGADALGFVFAPSKRRVTPEVAAGIAAKLDPFVTVVGVFKDAPLEDVLETKRRCRLDVVQLHGSEDESFVSKIPGKVIKAVTVEQLDKERYRNADLLVDSPGGGTGRTVAWESLGAFALKRRLILAGGLTPENVEAAIETVAPYGVDVSSGVESAPGIKDVLKMERFIRKVKAHA